MRRRPDTLVGLLAEARRLLELAGYPTDPGWADWLIARDELVERIAALEDASGW